MFNSMNNKKKCGAHDDINLASYDSIRTINCNCDSSGRSCRFSYASWCPICDVGSPRRRSKSEGVDCNIDSINYRKRFRDMKSPNSKTLDTTSVNSDYIRSKLDSSRVRTNLCELPTTYIKNCQSNVPSLNTDISRYTTRLSNFVEPFYDIQHQHNNISSLISENSHKKLMNMNQLGRNNDEILKKNGYSKLHYLSSAHREDNNYSGVNNKIRSNSLDSKVIKRNGEKLKQSQPSPPSTPIKQFIHVKEINIDSNRSSPVPVSVPVSPVPVKKRADNNLRTFNQQKRTGKIEMDTILKPSSATPNGIIKTHKILMSNINKITTTPLTSSQSENGKTCTTPSKQMNIKHVSNETVIVNKECSPKRLLPVPKVTTPRTQNRPKTCDSVQLRSENFLKFRGNQQPVKKCATPTLSSRSDNHDHNKYNNYCSTNRNENKTKNLHSTLLSSGENQRNFVIIPNEKSHSIPSQSTLPKTATTTTPLTTAPTTPMKSTIIDENINGTIIENSINKSLIEITTTTTAVTNNIEAKRYRVRLRCDSDNSNVNVESKTEAGSIITKKARDISPLQLQNNLKKDLRTRSAVKLASIKNRNKLSATKLRKVRSKIAHSVSSDSNLSESDSEESENDEGNETDSYDELFEDIHSINNMPLNVNGSTPTTHTYTENGSKTYEKWPLRESLFPHVPPYIKFASHDGDGYKLPSGATRYFKWRLSNITPIVVRKTLLNTGFRLVRSEYSRESNDWTGTWGKHIKSVCFQTLKETQKLNHFPGTFQIGRKDRLWKNLQRLMFKFGLKEFGFIPRSFVLPQDLKLLRQAWEKNGLDKWIIKPPASARGTGIKVIHRWSHLPKKKSLVVQQYISNPYLINGSKFDLRLYVLITSFNPLRIYLYPDGLARFASTKYSDDVSTLNDRYMHLTNYSINKLSSHYAANEDANACKGHKWTLSKLWEYLEKDGVNTKILWRSLQQLVIKTIICGESSISQLYKANVNSRYNCYELFGIDVLLDERLKPWLLEVNISPSLHSASPLDLHVKGPLVQDLLNLAQFHLSPKLSRLSNIPPCLNSNLYTTALNYKERLKHLNFVSLDKREQYLQDILNELTGDDVRHLIQAEDELTVIGHFERIFPTQHTHHYFQFMEVRYYNRLFDAWEYRYEKNRSSGIKRLQILCEKKIHLDVPPSSTIKKSLGENASPELEQNLETTSSNDSNLIEPVVLPQRPMTSPAPARVVPTIDALRNEIRYKMMNLKLDMNRSLSPF